MADGINAAVQAPKSAHPNAVGNRLPGHSCRQQLATGDDTALAIGQLTDHEVRMLVTFDVYGTYKVMSVGH
jgi:hypothetical protein